MGRFPAHCPLPTVHLQRDLPEREPARQLGLPRQLAAELCLELKLALVGTILAVAALNRWWLLPALKRGETRRLGRTMKLEALLLIAVFAATGLLTTRPLPHA